MKKKSMIIAAAMLLGAAVTANAQVTIGSDELPHATLDVVAAKTDGTTAEGIMAPRLTLAQLKAADTQYAAAQTGALVYITDAAGGTTAKTANVTAAGYYYFDGTLWHSVSGVDNNTLYDISYESSTSLLTLTPSTGGGSPVAIPLPKYTASNGLTESGNDVQLGGNLTKNTTIAQNANTLTFSGTGKTVISSPLQYNNTAALPGEDKVLTSDASGNATWQFPALPLIMGTATDENMIINMADYFGMIASNYVEVPFVSFTLPPGRWLLFYYIPFQFNFNNDSIAQVSFVADFRPEGDFSESRLLHKHIRGPIVHGITDRNLMMTIVNNTTDGNVKYTLRMGDFVFIFKNNSGIMLPATGDITVIPPNTITNLYAIGVK